MLMWARPIKPLRCSTQTFLQTEVLYDRLEGIWVDMAGSKSTAHKWTIENALSEILGVAEKGKTFMGMETMVAGQEK